MFMYEYIVYEAALTRRSGCSASLYAVQVFYLLKHASVHYLAGILIKNQRCKSALWIAIIPSIT